MIKHCFSLSVALLTCHSAWAMQALDDSDLSEISGRDGITITLDGGAGTTATAIQYTLESGLANEATLSANTMSLVGVNDDGSLGGAPSTGLVYTLDSSATELHMTLATTNRGRLRTDSLTIPTSGAPTRSFGTWAMDFEAYVELTNEGLFSDSDQAYLLGQLTNTDIYYRQGAHPNAYMAMHDLNAMWEIPEGTLSLTNEGIIMRTGDGNPGAVTTADLINLALDFEYVYKNPSLFAEADEFLMNANARGVMHFGWLGSVRDAELKWGGGGVWQGNYDPGLGIGNVYDPYGADAGTTISEGLRFSSQWDYVDAADAASLGDPEKEFRWRLGETADVAATAGVGEGVARINFELGDWTMWGTVNARKPASHYFPLIALDVINGAGQGPGGLCWGFAYNGPSGAGGACAPSASYDRQYVELTPGTIGSDYPAALQSAGNSGALAIMVRDGQLQSYSRRVRLIERDADGVITTRDFDWGLIYALANVDANFYIYPGGSVQSNSDGLIMDIALMSQTFADTDDAGTPTVNETYAQGFNWDHGTHLMIADTAANMGIGFLSTSFVLLGNDTRVWVRNQTDVNDYYGGGLDFFSPESRFNYRATFGGGLLPEHPDYGNASVPQTVRGTQIDLNLEGLVNLRFSPSHPDADDSGSPYYVDARNFLGFSGALRLEDTNIANFSGSTAGDSTDLGSYLSLAEPNQPDVALRLANITGDFSFTNGRVDIRGTNEDGDGQPKMVISNNVQLGTAAAARLTEAVTDTTALGGLAAGQPVQIDRIMLGDADLGKMIIPSAQIYSAITLQPQY